MNSPDLALKLTVMRQRAGLSQRQLARASGVGEKSISSFETGQRTHTLKVTQLDALVRSCGMTLSDFFAWGDDGDAFEADSADDVGDAAMDAVARTLAKRETPRPTDYPTPQSSLGKRGWVTLVGWSG